MLTLGIDLSTDPRRTAACLIEWGDPVEVRDLAVGRLDDERLLDHICGNEDHEPPDWIGIDAPFGWPQRFVGALQRWQFRERWPTVARQELYYRATDLVVESVARRPLSVSTDRIGATAMRCASLLDALAERRGLGRAIDRTGTQDRVIEVYPAASLTCWSNDEQKLDPDRYKGGKNAARRRMLLGALVKAAPYLDLEPIVLSKCETNDDALDALVAALTVRAAATDRTLLPTEEQWHAAEVEGWIHLPRPGSLGNLAA